MDSNNAATTFTWDVSLFGAQADADPATVNLSGLSVDNDFSSPDGLWFDTWGVLWIQTDDGAYADVTNCMMLAALPGAVGDGGELMVGGQRPGDLRHRASRGGASPTTAPGPSSSRSMSGSELRRRAAPP